MLIRLLATYLRPYRRLLAAVVALQLVGTLASLYLILVMESGSIVEQGTHADLLTRRGAYFDLYDSQFATAQTTAN